MKIIARYIMGFTVGLLLAVQPASVQAAEVVSNLDETQNNIT